MMKNLKALYPQLTVFIASLYLSACVSQQVAAPVTERTPTSKSSKASANKAPSINAATSGNEKDWRPDSHTVKKGDTLISIGLQYGYDYKELAQLNNLTPPYTIRVGQAIKLNDGSKPSADAATKPADATSNDGGVVIAPLKNDGIIINTTTPIPAPASTTTPVDVNKIITEPKAVREPYSEQAAAKAATAPVKADNSKPSEAAKVDASKTDAAPPPSTVGELSDWVWPSNGKVINGFNESSNSKGIDIGGTLGQPILAAGNGKIIYSGSDLRGYGKLVIIKHSKDLLSVYAHNSQIMVKEGQTMTKGQKIAEMGNTDTDRIKLHFEIRLQGKSVDPTKYLPANN
jgi:lipoprotein NlpD